MVCCHLCKKRRVCLFAYMCMKCVWSTEEMGNIGCLEEDTRGLLGWVEYRVYMINH